MGINRNKDIQFSQLENQQIIIVLLFQRQSTLKIGILFLHFLQL